jgi:formate hydrogenlyase subunit 6/NADH:ubiquinone oxidoreductase subunit I
MMTSSFLWYLVEFIRPSWVRKFFTVRTAPLLTPPYFRGFPEPTGKACTRALRCMMVCPAPGAIDVVKEADGWHPRIHRGHCIRCGLCVEACPNGVLSSGRVLESVTASGTALTLTFRIDVDTVSCMGCGNCAVACPVNRGLDPQMAYGGRASRDDLLLCVVEGKCKVVREDRCNGCKTCEDHCPNGAIRVDRVLQAVQAVSL